MKLRAEFLLDENGNPTFHEAKRKHYKIRLFVENAPPEAQAITYRLHETFYDPVREVFRGAGDDVFAEKITSYGDFDVVTVASSGTAPVKTALSKALEATYAEPSRGANRAIAEALDDIKKY